MIYDIDLLTVKEFNGLPGKVVILKEISSLSSQRYAKFRPSLAKNFTCSAASDKYMKEVLLATLL